MPKKEEAPRKRMLVEEVGPKETPEVPSENIAPTQESVEPNEKVGEAPTLTEGVSLPAEKPVELPKEVDKTTEQIVPNSTPPERSQNNVQGDYSSVKSSGGPGPMTIILPGILLLGALLGGIFFYQNKTSLNPSETPGPSFEPAPSSETTGTPTPKAEADLSKYKISILNGSGIAGEAGRAKDLLGAAGFTVSSTGNADEYSFTKTIIGAKSTVDKGFLDVLSTALGKTYVVGTNETLASSSADSVVVTIGSSKK